MSPEPQTLITPQACLYGYRHVPLLSTPTYPPTADPSHLRKPGRSGRIYASRLDR